MQKPDKTPPMRIAFTFSFLFVTLVLQAQRAYPFLENDKWGMITDSGREVVPPAYRFERGIQEYNSGFFYSPANIRPDINGLYRFYNPYNAGPPDQLSLYRCTLVDTTGHVVAVLDSLSARMAEPNAPEAVYGVPG